MIATIVMGLAAGARSMTPLAAVAWLARRRELPNESPIARLLASGPVAGGATVLAVGEILGDKLRIAPDRIVVPGMAARILTGAVAGAAVSDRRHGTVAALLGAATAIGSAYLTFEARRRAMRRFGQGSTGALEDVAILACVLFAADAARRAAGSSRGRM